MNRAQLLGQVQGLRAEGTSIRAIAARLGIHRSTVERALHVLEARQDGTRDSRRRPPVSRSATPFVGRKEVMQALRRALGAMLAGRGQVVLLTGEPGIGKTRTAQELARHATRRGALVLEGPCYEREGAPPYWPWVQAIRASVRAQSRAGLRSQMGRDAAVIADIVPEIKQRLPGLEPPPALDPRSAQFRLFDAITSFFKSASRQHPLLVFLDDLHRADHPSVLLLEFMGRALRDSPVLLLGAYRDTEVGVAHPLSGVLGAMGRERHFQRIQLSGLSPADVADFIKATSGELAAARFASMVFERTAGNPLFVTHLVRHLSLEDALDSAETSYEGPQASQVPESIREAVRFRFQRLSPACQEVLKTAAVLGRDFSHEHLGRVTTDRTSGDLLVLLAEARTARLIDEVPGSLTRYRFGHVIVQEALADELPEPTRVQLHTRIVGLFEGLAQGEATARASEMAYHCAEALPVLGPDQLVRYSTIAGEQALAAYAFNEAVSHFQRALDANSEKPIDGQGARLLLNMARAQAARSSFGGSIADFDWAKRAFEYYVAHGRWREAAEAVEIAPMTFHPEFLQARLELVRRLIDSAPADSLEAARALSVYGDLIGMGGNLQGAREAFDHALAIAQKSPDQRLELSTLMRMATVDAYHWQARLEDCHRVIELARQLGDPAAELQGSWLAMLELVGRGDAEVALSLGLRAARQAEKVKSPFLVEALWGMLGALYADRGEWDRGREALDRAAAWGPQVGPTLISRAALELQAGEFRRGEEYLQRATALVDWASPVMTFERGLVAETASIAARITRDERWQNLAKRAAELPSGLNATTVAAMFARVAAAHTACMLQDRTAAQEQYEDFARTYGVSWCTMAGPALISTQRLMGLLCRTAGRTDEALGHFQRSADFCRRAGYRPELAWSCYDYADALIARASPDDLSLARALLDEARRLTTSLGMDYLTDRIAALQQRLESRPARARYPDGLSAREVEVLRLLAEGKTNKEIAKALVVTSHTVGHHLRHIFSKTNAANRTEAAVYAHRKGLAKG